MCANLLSLIIEVWKNIDSNINSFLNSLFILIFIVQNVLKGDVLINQVARLVQYFVLNPKKASKIIS